LNAVPKISVVLANVIVSAIVVGFGMVAAVSWWRRYFRRLFEARFQPQEDDTYLAYWVRRRGRPVEVYRIDALTKESALTRLIDGSVLSTALFVTLIIGTVAISVLWPALLMIPVACLLPIIALVIQRRATHQAERSSLWARASPAHKRTAFQNRRRRRP
jgi:ABC-type bacteriocin/lantibiotic exporter with double-glycine peptidase domain